MTPGSEWASAIAEADLVVLGPAPPLRGGIAQHTLRLGESALAAGRRVAVVSFRRLYPASLFPGRSQNSSKPAPDWSREVLDVLRPPSWLGVARALQTSRAVVVLQWWHPVTAPAYAAATWSLPRERLAAICHNATPHEPVPGAGAAARFVLSRCGSIVCHSGAEARRLGALLDGRAEIRTVPLPCLVSESDLAARPPVPELAGFDGGHRLVVAAGHVRPYKGIGLLLRAWQRANLPAGARLVVVGESYLSDSERRAIAGMAARDETIVLVDRYVDDAELVQFLRSAELLVCAHRSASQSGLLPIAQSLGVPCIVSDAGGLAEQAAAHDCRPDVVRAGDEDDLRSALERRLDGPPRTTAVVPGAAAERAAGWSRVVEAVLVEVAT